MLRVNVGFIQDLLATVGATTRISRTGVAGTAPEVALHAACTRLLGNAGEATRIAAAQSALDACAALSAPQKLAFFRRLLDDLGPDIEAVRAACAAFGASESAESMVALFRAVEPRRQELLRLFNLCPGGTIRLVRMREDLLAAMKTDPALGPIDVDFQHLFASWFNRGFLVMQEIDWTSPAVVLEKIVAYEAVHEIQGWDDLRRRLDPDDRRCFAFFHPATGDEPLVFVEVALCRGIPGDIAAVLQGGGTVAPSDADTAVFYSISNCQPGLKGVSFGSFLIKQVVQELARELPGLRTFVTLSPVPGFATWLGGEGGADADLSSQLSAGDWTGDGDPSVQALASDVRHAAARYLSTARPADGQPVDPVARFHLGNGAILHRIHWPADLSVAGLARGHGVMVNYLYEPDMIDSRHEAYVTDRTIAIGPEIRRDLKR